MRRGAAVVLLVGVLTGCAQASPREELAARADDVTRTANAQDAEGLREATLALADEVSAQREAGELDPEEATRLLELATALRGQADLVDPAVQAREAAQARAEAEQARQEAEQAREQAAADAAADEAAEKAAADKAAADKAAADKAAADKAADEAAADAAAEDEGDDDEGKGKGRKGDED